MSSNEYICGERLSTLEYDKAVKDLLSIARRGEGVVVNMSKCHYISSSGIRAFMIVAKAIPQYGKGKLVLTNVNDDVMQILEKVGFASVVKIE